MNNYATIEDRVVEVSTYIINTEATVRQAAEIFGISKSTVHNDVSERIKNISPSLASEVRVVLDINKEERHYRGGMATKNKYLNKRGN